jgi:hypothetical protein
MTEAATIASAVDDDPSLREALQSLIRSIGWRVATFGSTSSVLTDNRPNAPGGSVAYCHSPSLSDILPSIINGVKRSTVEGKGAQGQTPAALCDTLAPESRESRHALRVLTTSATDPETTPS